jgi:hypothetical protein
MRRSSVLRTAGYILLGIGAASAVGALVVRDQMSRHQRNLFSGQALKRLAALGYLSGSPATVALVQLLRDFVAWEPNALIRRRAVQLLARMERQLGRATNGSDTPAGIAG